MPQQIGLTPRDAALLTDFLTAYTRVAMAAGLIAEAEARAKTVAQAAARQRAHTHAAGHPSAHPQSAQPPAPHHAPAAPAHPGPTARPTPHAPGKGPLPVEVETRPPTWTSRIAVAFGSTVRRVWAHDARFSAPCHRFG